MTAKRQRDGYERMVLRALRRMLLDEPPDIRHGTNRIFVEDVQYVDAAEEHLIVVLFREETRPACLFGWRTELSWPDDPITGNGVGFRAAVATANFQEDVEALGYGLPDTCDPQDVTWIQDSFKPTSNGTTTPLL